MFKLPKFKASDLLFPTVTLPTKGVTKGIKEGVNLFSDEKKKDKSPKMSTETGTNRLQQLMDPNSAGQLQVTGTPEERAGAVAGLERGKLLFGKDLSSIGQDNFQYLQDLKGRATGGSAEQERVRTLANTLKGRQAADQRMMGVKTLGRTASSEGINRQAALDERAITERNQDRYASALGNAANATLQLEASMANRGNVASIPALKNEPSLLETLFGGLI